MPHYQVSQFQFLSQESLFERLTKVAAAPTVVTPNSRLSQALHDEFNQYQFNRQCSVWQTADILPFASFVERSYQDALYSFQEITVPLLLTPVQEHMLWEEVIQSDETGGALLNITQTAHLAHEAWQLLHAWQLTDSFKQYPLNEDSDAFRNWTVVYRNYIAGKNLIDHASLIDLIRQWYSQDVIRKPNGLFYYGFDHLTPQQVGLLNVLNRSGCSVWMVQPATMGYAVPNIEASARIRRVCYTDAREEIYHAAIWVRSKLEANPNASIGVVVPALTNCRSVVERIFSEVMQPDVQEALPQSHHNQSPSLPFNISLGLPLSNYPIAEAALSLLKLVGRKTSYDLFSDLLRSPFIGGGETEINDRALLDLKLRQCTAPELTLEQFVSLLHLTNKKGKESDLGTICPILEKNFSALLAYYQREVPQQASHAVYAKVILKIFEIVGFPGERTLDSREYQTFKKFQTIVAELAMLDRVIPQTAFVDAVSRLGYIAANTQFQPQTPQVPIQILGILEAAGLWFDHLWVMGLSDEQWPLRSSPNPFLPYVLQKKSRMPLGSAEAALEFSQRLCDNWLTSATEVVLSHPKFGDGNDAQEIFPTSMIRSIPEDILDLPNYPSHRDLIIKTANLECIQDDYVQPVIKQEFSGGVSVIKDFSACPFRAWARHKMAAETIDEPYVGLNAMDRGIVLHHALALVWRELKTKQALISVTQEYLESIVMTAVDGAVAQIEQKRPFALSERFLSIERRRLLRLIHEWLELERSREDFQVLEVEQKHSIQIGALKLHGRMDRIDRVANNKRLIIDYKTSQYGVDSMLGERPDEPQLPLYLVMTDLPVADTVGVAFASVKSGKMNFSAIVYEDGVLPDIYSFDKTKACAGFATWEQLLEEWNRVFLHLADSFLSGNAQVAPKNYPETCRHCDLHAFCRIEERLFSTGVQGGADE